MNKGDKEALVILTRWAFSITLIVFIGLGERWALALALILIFIRFEIEDNRRAIERGDHE